MAKRNSIIENPTTTPAPRWPFTPEEMLPFLPKDMDGSPHDLLSCALTRTGGLLTLLLSEFMGAGDYRPDDQEITEVLWIAQGHLQLAQRLLERAEVSHA